MNKTNVTQDTFTTRQLAERWHISTMTLRRWRREGRVRAVILSSRRVIFLGEEVARVERDATV